MDIEKTKLVNLDILGERLGLWFIERKWELKTERGPTTFALQARKAGKIRVFLAACRALIVICKHENGKTIVSVRQGSWTENIWSNAAWLVATGGTNLLFSLWSFEVQREFQNYVKSLLEEI